MCSLQDPSTFRGVLIEGKQQVQVLGLGATSFTHHLLYPDTLVSECNPSHLSPRLEPTVTGIE